MKVNIVIPVYNAAPYLAQCMDSLCGQTFQDFDIVAVDDGSTDDSLAVLRAYRGFFGERLSVFRNAQNLGPGPARNVGLENLPEDGEYLLFLDADDYAEPGYLQKLVTAAEQYRADIVICGMDRFDTASGKHTGGEMLTNPEKLFEHLSDCRELAYINTFLYNKLLRRSLAESLRFPAMKRWEEMTFLFEYLMAADRVKFLNEVLYHYRQRPDSLTGGICEETYSAALRGLQQQAARLQAQGQGYAKIRDFFEVQVFIRCGIGGVCRMAVKDMKKARLYVRQAGAYLAQTLPGWRSNPYLRLRGAFRRRAKENAIALAACFYRHGLFVVFVWAYWLMTAVLKKDIRY